MKNTELIEFFGHVYKKYEEKIPNFDVYFNYICLNCNDKLSINEKLDFLTCSETIIKDIIE